MITNLERRALNQAKVALDAARTASYMWTWRKDLKAPLDLPANAFLKSGIEAELKQIQEHIGSTDSWISAVLEVTP